MRNLSVYRTMGKTTLDLDVVNPRLIEDIIKNNSLLEIKDDQIYFKFEEALKEKKQNGTSI